ncbi:HsdM family class I SAM-dependent methyltransferase [Parabacteroides distasonis]|jgi:type I restriction enzyme M protein|uniref:site-specific DNA-methyltransferase (adenine-specific) n=1 Tax=Parabacteroides distasonis TaxID=823 RepID=A0A8D9LCF0_PARDI|nr:class I SAM-dependent DNA methyltransferase [Parabacteroides distasonis]CUO86897.1 Probable type I restriction enzyme BthVORF4518P M protein [Parabacteroides distasonis]
MITGEKKHQVDNIWQIFWNSGFTQPSAIFEQITYLLFMKMLDEKQLEKESVANLTGDKLLNPTFPEGDWHNPSTDQDVPYNELRWHIFKEFEPSYMLNRVRNDVFIFLRSIGGTGSAYSKAMEDTVFQITNARLLSRVVEGIEELASDGADMMGDVYEYMLGKMAASGTNGQFRTPRHIIRMMVELMKPTLDDTICDPAMGSAGFLMEAAKYIQEHQSDELLNIETINRFRCEIFHGSDSDASMMRIGCMNMMLHDVDEPQLYYRNSLSDENNDANKYTLCLANPPFAGSLDQDDIAQTLKAAVKTKKTELLFLALMMRMLQSGGRCASVVPDTVLTGDAQAYKTIRSALVDNHCLQAVITMPSGVFQPYSGVSTAIIIFTKTGTGGTDKVWFYDMHADGFSLTTQRTPTPERNDIPDIISRFHSLEAEANRNRKEQSFFVSADEIRANGYDLSYKRYHEVEREAVVYDAPEVIIARMEERQKAIDAAFAEFKKLLNS